MSYKRWIFIAIFLFGIGLVLGLVAPASIFSLISQQIVALGELSNILVSLPSVLTALLIFVWNASALMLSFILSPIFCLTPILALTMNGSLLGFVSVLGIQERSVGFILSGLLPHGVIEIPALILGQAAALSFGSAAILALFKKERRNLLLPTLKQNFRYVLLALGLLFPAAFIETYVTPLMITQYG